jgi:alkanesulfonate monooxygenase SsuD/methylene tetrahydromethanopterin reductase-like flavin-dependent oxidoreductase (luciferase family)
MRTGLMLGTAGDPGAVAAEARRAEELGFDLVAAGEHVFFYGPTANAFVTLASAAAVTERVRLLSALTILPLYPMAMAAKLASTLDLISHGRFDLGVGVGGEFPPEFAASGVPVEGRGARADEALAVLVRLLSGERVTADGRFGSLRDLRLDPPPVQRPRPPIWVGGRKTPAMRRAGRFADAWMPYMVSPGSFGRSLAQVREFAVEAGRPAAAVGGALFIWGSVDADAGRARREAVEFVSRVYRQDFSPLAGRYLLHGDPDTVVARLAEYHAAGAETVIFSPACAPERHADVTALFAEAVRTRLPGHDRAGS